jgi:uncharacterized membrane protein
VGNLKFLLKSRKFWISLVTIVMLIAVSFGVQLDESLVEQIVNVVMVLVAAIAAEDIAHKLKE